MKCVTGRRILCGLPGQCHPGDQSNLLIILVSILEQFIILSNYFLRLSFYHLFPPVPGFF